MNNPKEVSTNTHLINYTLVEKEYPKAGKYLSKDSDKLKLERNKGFSGYTINIKDQEFSDLVNTLNDTEIHLCYMLKGINVNNKPYIESIDNIEKAKANNNQDVDDWISRSQFNFPYQDNQMFMFDVDDWDGTIEEWVELMNNLIPNFSNVPIIVAESSSAHVYHKDDPNNQIFKTKWHVYVPCINAQSYKQFGSILKARLIDRGFQKQTVDTSCFSPIQPDFLGGADMLPDYYQNRTDAYIFCDGNDKLDIGCFNDISLKAFPKEIRDKVSSNLTHKNANNIKIEAGYETLGKGKCTFDVNDGIYKGSYEGMYYHNNGITPYIKCFKKSGFVIRLYDEKTYSTSKFSVKIDKTHNDFKSLMPVEEVRKQIQSDVYEWISTDLFTQIMKRKHLMGIKDDCGIGKSYNTIKAINSANEQVLYFVKSHAMGKQFIQDHNTGFVIKGRCKENCNVYDKAKPSCNNCFNKDDCQKKGSICDQYIMAYNCPQCKFNDDCSYVDQFEEAQDHNIVFLAHNYLFTPNNMLINHLGTRKTLVVDENITKDMCDIDNMEIISIAPYWLRNKRMLYLDATMNENIDPIILGFKFDVKEYKAKKKGKIIKKIGKNFMSSDTDKINEDINKLISTNGYKGIMTYKKHENICFFADEDSVVSTDHFGSLGTTLDIKDGDKVAVVGRHRVPDYVMNKYYELIFNNKVNTPKRIQQWKEVNLYDGSVVEQKFTYYENPEYDDVYRWLNESFTYQLCGRVRYYDKDVELHIYNNELLKGLPVDVVEDWQKGNNLHDIGMKMKGYIEKEFNKNKYCVWKPKDISSKIDITTNQINTSKKTEWFKDNYEIWACIDKTIKNKNKNKVKIMVSKGTNPEALFILSGMKYIKR